MSAEAWSVSVTRECLDDIGTDVFLRYAEEALEDHCVDNALIRLEGPAEIRMDHVWEVNRWTWPVGALWNGRAA